VVGVHRTRPRVSVYSGHKTFDLSLVTSLPSKRSKGCPASIHITSDLSRFPCFIPTRPRFPFSMGTAQMLTQLVLPFSLRLCPRVRTFDPCPATSPLPICPRDELFLHSTCPHDDAHDDVLHDDDSPHDDDSQRHSLGRGQMCSESIGPVPGSRLSKTQDI
jgi:hypothetical protein